MNKFITLLVAILTSSTLFSQNPVCGFQYKKIITIQGSQITGGPHTDFPILIQETDLDLRTTANGGDVTDANGYDVIFADDAGNPLDFQLENYVATTGEYVAWVRIPTLTNGTDVDIHMLYGKASITTDQSTTTTWDANYKSILHMNENGNTTAGGYADGTTNGHDATGNSMTGTSDVAAKIGIGQDFDGTADFLEIADHNDFDWTAGVTMAAWVNSDVPTGPIYRGLMVKGRPNGSTTYWGGMFLTTGGIWHLRYGNKTSNAASGPTAGTWYYVVATYLQGGACVMYVDGVQVLTNTANAGNIVNGTERITIGYADITTEYFDGKLDEVRWSNVARSANWIATQHAAQNTPSGTFYTVGIEVDIYHTSTQNGDWDLTSRWDNGVVPNGIFENVDIQHDIDIDGGSADYTICDCNINGTGTTNSYLDLTNARILTVKGNLDANYTGTGTSGLRLRLENTTIVNVEGNMNWVSSNTDLTEEMIIRATDNGIINLTGDFTGSLSAGKDLYFDLNNDSRINFSSDVTLTQTGGDNIDIRIDGTAEMNIGGNFLMDHDGGDDMPIYLNDNNGTAAEFNVTGNLSIDHDGGDDITFRLSGNGSVFYIGGNFSGDFTSTDDDDMMLDLNEGIFFVTGTTTLTRNTDYHEVLVDMDNGDFTSGDLTLNINGTTDADHSIWLNVDGTSTLTVNGNVAINATGGNFVQMYINNANGSTGTIDINGNMSIDQDAGNTIALRSLGASSVFDISGTFTCDHDGGSLVEIQTGGTNAQFNIGSTATINWNDGAGSEFEFDGDDGTITIGGLLTGTRGLNADEIQIDLDGGNINLNSGSVFNSGGATGGGGAIDIRLDNGSVLTNTGNMAVTMSGGDDFTLRVDGGLVAASQFLCTGNLTINRSAGDNINISAEMDNSLIDIDGDMTINSSGGEQFTMTLENNSTVDVAGSVTITHTEGQNGLIEMITGGTPSFNVGNDFSLTISAGDDDYLMDLDLGQMTVGQDFSITEATGDNELFLDMDGTNLSVTRDFFATLGGGGSGSGDVLMEVDNGSVMTISGNAELDISGGNDIEFYVERRNTFGNSQVNIVGDLLLDHNGSVGGDNIEIILYDNAALTVGGIFTMDTDGSGAPGNFYTRLNNNSTMSVTGNMQMINNVGAGYLELELNNNALFQIGGNFVRGASPNNYGLLDCNGTSTIEYNGAANTQLFAEDAGAGTDFFDYQNVIINNSFGSNPEITMEGLATVHSGITWSNGVVATTNTDLLIFDDNATTTGASEASHAEGPVRKIGDDAFDFPVGKNDTAFAPISISAPGVTTDHFTGEYYQINPDLVLPTPYTRTSKDAALNHVSGCEYWILDRTNGSSNVSVGLSWDDRSCDVTNLPTLAVARWDGTDWKDHGNGGTTGNTANGTVSSAAAITNFSPFTLASTDAGNPLPVELSRFEANANEGRVDLKWVTKSEINNDYFNIERSIDGVLWESIITADGAGNSNQTLEYYEADFNPLNGISYYRLKQTDFNGQFKYSNIVPVKFEANKSSVFSIFPNPVRAGEAIQISFDNVEEEILVVLRDIQGKEFYTKLFINIENEKLVGLPIYKDIPEGIYLITASSKNQIYSHKLIIR